MDAVVYVTFLPSNPIHMAFYLAHPTTPWAKATEHLVRSVNKLETTYGYLEWVPG